MTSFRALFVMLAITPLLSIADENNIDDIGRPLMTVGDYVNKAQKRNFYCHAVDNFSVSAVGDGLEIKDSEVFKNLPRHVKNDDPQANKYLKSKFLFICTKWISVNYGRYAIRFNVFFDEKMEYIWDEPRERKD